MKFSINARSENNTKTLVDAGKFSLTIDEPENLGGTDQGPNPVEYVLAALAGCLNVVGHMVANEMNINMGEIKFDIEGDLDPAKFQGKDTDERAGYQNIRVKITPETDASEEDLQKWLKTIETRCPVSDNISNKTNVEITV